MITSGWLLPVMELKPRTLMDTAEVLPPGAACMRTPEALPYKEVAKFGVPVFTSSPELIVLMAYPSFLASFLIPKAVTTTSSNACESSASVTFNTRWLFTLISCVIYPIKETTTV
ncbi:hypothetical protein Barb7_02435 [Bacteroidales bacterium Barb7]|nr:hypothetical protein Barb7_02435 [Bacteroidales bacterium Barb7]